MIANIVILILLCMTHFADKGEGTITFENYEIVFLVMNHITQATFIVFASVLVAKLIIEEYKNKTIMLMFMYPIQRKKIMIAKLLIVGGFTFVTIFLSNIIIGSAFYFIDSFLHMVPARLTNELILTNIVKTGVDALESVGIGLLPLYFGMRKKSVPATIISAVVIVFFLSSSVDNFSLSSIVAIPISLAIIGVFAAYLSIRNVEKADVTE